MRFAILLVCLGASAISQEPRLNWVFFQEPVYPQMARIAHILGRVTLEITANPDGKITIGNAVGHPILVQAAKDSVQKSKLSCEGCGAEPHSFTIVYEFGFADPLPPPARIVPPPARENGLFAVCTCGDAGRSGSIESDLSMPVKSPQTPAQVVK